MVRNTARVLCGLLFVLCSALVPTGRAQQTKPVNVTQITGLVKNKSGGKLSVDGTNLRFVANEGAKVDVPANTVEDVITGADSQRLIHGTLGTLTMFAPYESGRFLSLFRTKLDTLTIKYRDTDGGLHGAIFTMAAGKAELIKKDLLAQGAHTTVPVGGNDAGTAAKEQKP